MLFDQDDDLTPEQKLRRQMFLENGAAQGLNVPELNPASYSQMGQLPPSLGTALSAFTGDWGGKPLVAQAPAVVPGTDAYEQMVNPPSLFGADIHAALNRPMASPSPIPSLMSPPVDDGPIGPNPISPLWHNSGGAMVSDGFDGAGNLLRSQASAAMPGAGYTSNSAAGIMPLSHPSDAMYAAGLQTQRANLADQMEGPQLFQHALRMQLANAQNATELEKARIMTGGKEEANFNKGISLTSDARIETPQALAAIKDMRDRKHISPEDADAMTLARITKQRGPDGKTLIPLYDSRDPSNNMTGLMNALASDEVKAMKPDTVKRFLENSMGVTRNKVVGRLNDLMEKGKPWFVGPMTGSLVDAADPAWFSRGRLKPEQQTEYDMILNLFGHK